MTHTQRTHCRACNSRQLYPLLDLGSIVPSDFLQPDQPDPPATPLAVLVCDDCHLVQLQHTVDPEQLYRQYWYRSGVNEVMRAELADVVVKAVAVLGRPLQARDTVVDVGANDGTLLSQYFEPEEGITLPHRIAFEPAFNLQTQLATHADLIYPDFFPGPSSKHLVTRSVTILSSIAMIYDLDDPAAFVREVDRVLAPDGVWVVQFQDLAQMVETRAFDNIVAEHLCYYSLTSFARLIDLAEVDLFVAKVERREINGGSLRLYIRRKNQAAETPDPVVWQAERACTSERLEKFAWEIGQAREQICGLVDQSVRMFDYIDLYAASTKSSTLLQYCGLDHRQIRRAAERTPEKVGRVTSGTRIPIVSETEWRERVPAAVTLIGAWQFAGAFLWREAQYLADGSHFIVPLPQPRIVSHAQR